MFRAVAFKISLLLLFQSFSVTTSQNVAHFKSDPFISREVADFQNWLQEKISNQEIAISRTARHLKEDIEENVQQVNNTTPDDIDDKDWTSEMPDDISYEDVQEAGSTENLPDVSPSLERTNSTSQHGLVPQDKGALETPSAFNVEEKEHHPVKEIVYIRESDSDLTGSLKDFLIKALSPKKPDDTNESEDPDSDLNHSLSDFMHKALSQDHLQPDTCSATNHTFYDGQTCASGAGYALEPHLSATYSEDLKAQMMERYSPRKDSTEVACGFGRRVKRDQDITQRALCPFQWVVSKRDPSRIPEYLFEAKCSCRDSCAELKSKIRVLWRVGCEDKLHVYREGWTEIAVACVPTKMPATKSKKAFAVSLPLPYPE